MMDRENLYLIISLIVLIGTSFYLGINYTDINSKTKEFIQNKLYDDDAGCYGVSLLIDSVCLNSQLKKFYVFNGSQVGKKLSLEQFKSEGGVCSHAVEYYIENFKRLDYEYRDQCSIIYENDTTNNKFITNVKFRTSNDSAHTIAIISGSDSTGNYYCVLDQTILKCFELGGNGE